MPDADRCCGGGGAFTFTHSKVSEKVAARKMDAVASVSPDIVSTSCPVCRIQLMDMLRRRFVLEAEKGGEKVRRIAVRTPAELLAGELRKALEGRPEAVSGE
jgi:Fe-S oxidoreductase